LCSESCSAVKGREGDRSVSITVSKFETRADSVVITHSHCAVQPPSRQSHPPTCFSPDPQHYFSICKSSMQINTDLGQRYLLIRSLAICKSSMQINTDLGQRYLLIRSYQDIESNQIYMIACVACVVCCSGLCIFCCYSPMVKSNHSRYDR
jgi:hypothetical protein